MKIVQGVLLPAVITLACSAVNGLAADDVTTFQEAFTKGKITGDVKSYFFGQTFESDT